MDETEKVQVLIDLFKTTMRLKRSDPVKNHHITVYLDGNVMEHFYVFPGHE